MGMMSWLVRSLRFSATDKIAGRSSSGAGPGEEIACTAAGRALLDDADAAAQRTTLGAAASGAATASGLTMATARLLGRTTAATGAIEEITVGTGLTLSAGTLSVSGGGSAAWESTAGQFRAVPASVTAGDCFYYNASVPNSGTNVAHIFDNSVALSGSTQLVSFRNNGVEKASIGDTGIGEFPAGIGLCGTANPGVGISWGGPTNVASMFPWNGGMYYHSYGVSYRGLGVLGEITIAAGRAITFDGTPSTVTIGDTTISKSAASGGEWASKYDAVEVGNVGDVYTTTDATATTIWDETLGDNIVHVIEVLVTSRRTDSAGRWSGRRRVTVYRAGGGATIEGSVETLGTDVAVNITPTVTFDVTSNDVRVRVTGEAAKTIKWRASVVKVHAN